MICEGREAHVWDHAAAVASVVASGGVVTEEFGRDVSVGAGDERERVALQEGARAIVASARGVDHDRFCMDVRGARWPGRA